MPKNQRAALPPVAGALLRAFLLLLVALAPSLAAAQPGTEVRLDSQAWRRLNVFFSNFAEAEVEPFRQGEIPHATLVRFGVMHHVVNAPERIDHTLLQFGLGRVRASDAAAAVATYFDVHLQPRAGPVGDPFKVTYADGYYVFSEADYPSHPFAQVAHLVDAGDGEFVATVGIFDDLDGDEAVHARSFEEMERAGDSAFEGRTMRARIRRVRERGRERYVLAEWLLAP